MNATKIYTEAVEYMCEEFWEKYFKEEGDIPQYHIIWSWGRSWGRTAPWLVDFQEYYVLTVDSIRECLYHNIPKETRQERYEDETSINLVSYAKWLREYTKEEKKKDQNRIKQIKEDLNALADEYVKNNKGK